MITNEQKLHIRKIGHQDLNKQIKKFNSKGYFYQVEPYDDEYLKKKHLAYEKYRNIENKQNFVYNLSQSRMRLGYYQMKGCTSNEQKAIKKRRILKTLDSQKEAEIKNLQSRTDSQSQNVISSLFKKYLTRKQRLKAKSEKNLTLVFAEIKSNSHSIRSNSQQTSQMSYKTSERDSRVLQFNHMKVNQKRILPTQLQIQRNPTQIIAVYKQKIRSRRLRMQTIE